MSISDDGSRTTIITIDDDPAMVELIKLVLKSEEFEVAGAYGGVEGLALVKKLRPALVLLDIMMPDMDGWQVYQQMRADDLTYHIPVIIVSAKPENDTKALMNDPGIPPPAAHLTKPFVKADLIKAVHRAIAYGAG